MKLICVAVITVAILLSAAVAGQEQRVDRDRISSQYVISARAGVVTLTEGDVTFRRAAEDWNLLIAGDELITGDSVMTGAGGRVEILLNPGSYFRLAGQSEFDLLDSSLDSLKLGLTNGSAVVEAGIVAEPITISTPRADFKIVKRGVYRFEVTPDRSSAAVRKGKLLLAGKTVKEGRRAVVTTGNPTIAKFDKKSEDVFDNWSKERAKTLVAANRRLAGQQRVARSFFSRVRGEFWFYSPLLGCYTLLPIFPNFSSPYGYGYPVYCPLPFGRYPPRGDRSGNPSAWPPRNPGSGSVGGRNPGSGGNPGGQPGGGQARPPRTGGVDSGGAGRGRSVDMSPPTPRRGSRTDNR